MYDEPKTTIKTVFGLLGERTQNKGILTTSSDTLRLDANG